MDANLGGGDNQQNRLLLKTKRKRGRIRPARKEIHRWKFEKYIRRLNRVINAKIFVQKDSMKIISDTLRVFAQRMCEEAKEICAATGRKTLHAKDLDDAARLVLGDNAIYRHGQLECEKALVSYGLSYAAE